MTLLLRLIIIAIVVLTVLLVISLLLRRRETAARRLTLGYPPRSPRPSLLPRANRGRLRATVTADWRAADLRQRLGETRTADGSVAGVFETEYNVPKWVHAAVLEELGRVGFDVAVVGEAGDGPTLHTELIDARILPDAAGARVVLGARLLDESERELLAERYEEQAARDGSPGSDEAWADALEQALQQAAQMIAFDVVARLPAPQDDETAA